MDPQQLEAWLEEWWGADYTPHVSQFTAEERAAWIREGRERFAAALARGAGRMGPGGVSDAEKAKA